MQSYVKMLFIVLDDDHSNYKLQATNLYLATEL